MTVKLSLILISCLLSRIVWFVNVDVVKNKIILVGVLLCLYVLEKENCKVKSTSRNTGSYFQRGGDYLANWRAILVPPNYAMKQITHSKH